MVRVYFYFSSGLIQGLKLGHAARACSASLSTTLLCAGFLKGKTASDMTPTEPYPLIFLLLANHLPYRLG